MNLLTAHVNAHTQSLIYTHILITHTLTHPHAHTFTKLSHTLSPSLGLQMFYIPIADDPPQNIIKSDF